MTGWDNYSRLQDKYFALSDKMSAVIGHMMNAQFALESDGTKREAIDILKRGIAIAMEARQGGDAKQARGASPTGPTAEGGDAHNPSSPSGNSQ